MASLPWSQQHIAGRACAGPPEVVIASRNFATSGHEHAFSCRKLSFSKCKALPCGISPALGCERQGHEHAHQTRLHFSEQPCGSRCRTDWRTSNCTAPETPVVLVAVLKSCSEVGLVLPSIRLARCCAIVVIRLSTVYVINVEGVIRRSPLSNSASRAPANSRPQSRESSRSVAPDDTDFWWLSQATCSLIGRSCRWFDRQSCSLG